MKMKIQHLLNVILGATVGVTCATVLTRWQDYQQYPAAFEAGASPWWMGILIPAVLGAAIVAACVVLKIVLRRKKED